MIAAIIPAREGSKRIPKQNIRPFAGKPMIAHAIQSALDAGVFDRVIVSTDSDEVAQVAEEFGAQVPFRRPAELSTDQAPLASVLAHALDWLRTDGQRTEYACCLSAAAPFVRLKDLRQGLETIRTHGCSSCYSVTSYPFPIFRSLRLNERGCLEMFWPEYEMTRSQDLPETCHDASQFYWVDCARFLQHPCLHAPDSRPIVLPRYLELDLDTADDWVRAEHMFRALAQES